MSIIDKVFGTHSDRMIKKIMPLVNKTEALEEEYKSKSDAELSSMTDKFKERLKGGETLDDILPEAFALVREADDRILGKRPFKVQLIGGIILHMGKISEMKTGEGKTLVATLPAYLNALNGKGVNVITVNEYLARTGFDEMSRVFGFLGLSTGLILHDQSSEEKRAAYGCDITYGTNNELGFDYLRDNMAVRKSDVVQRGFEYAIVDEVDSILIDEARTPLIISGMGEKSNELYKITDKLARSMNFLRVKKTDDKQEADDITEDGTPAPDKLTAAVNSMLGKNDEAKSIDDIKYDYIVDEKARTAVLTAKGIAKAEAFYKINDLSDPENTNLAHYLNKAIYAHGVMKADVDYVVKDGAVLIVDSFTGRIMPGRRYSDGLHQAIEAKENVEVENETKTLATITLQNFFRMYHKLSGMTGTALTEAEEFNEIYGLDVVSIPTNKPMIRIDRNDVIYQTEKAKWNAIIEQIEECHAKDQPVLVGTVSVEKSEVLSALLRKKGIQHTVLNAKYHEKEAEIVAMAGKPGTVTIATNMAGRGTDIMLGGNAEFLAKQQMKHDGYDDEVIGLAVGTSLSVPDEVLEARKVFKDYFLKFKAEVKPEAEKVCNAGGLYIIGTERHESRRIDNQLRGRSGRQGDPGESRFFISMQDDMMRLFGGDRMYSIVTRLGVPEDQPLDAKILSNQIEAAQKRREANNFARRKTVLEYDDVMNKQRNLIYTERREVLDGADISDKIRTMISESISRGAGQFLSGSKEEWDINGLVNLFFGIIFRPEDVESLKEKIESGEIKEASDIENLMQERASKLYESKYEIFGQDVFKDIERTLLLRAVDMKWMDHLEDMENLRDSVGLNAYAQRNPLTEYRVVGGDIFDQMVASIREETVRMVLSVVPREKIERKAVAKVTGTVSGDDSLPKTKKNKAAPTLKGKNVPLLKSNKINPNDPCPCGSGKKYKKCCGMSSTEEK